MADLRLQDGDFDLFESLVCPICSCLMKDPVTSESGHSYCRNCIQHWFANNNTCPMTNEQLSSKTLFPSHTLKKAIAESQHIDFGVIKEKKIKSLQTQMDNVRNETDSELEQMKQKEEELKNTKEKLEKARVKIEKKLKQNKAQKDECEQMLKDAQNKVKEKEKAFNHVKEQKKAHLLSLVDQLRSFDPNDSSQQTAPKKRKLSPITNDFVSVSVVNQRGDELSFKIRRTTAMRRLTSAYLRKQGQNASSVRFLFNFESLDPDDTADSLNMHDGDRISAMPQQTGSIGTFTTTNASDELTQYLLLTDAERQSRQPPNLNLFVNSSVKHNADINISFTLTQSNVLSPPQRKTCVELMDAACAFYFTSKGKPIPADIKLVVPADAFNRILQGSNASDASDDDVYRQVVSLHTRPNAAKIVLRRSCGPTEGCIGFHCDVSTAPVCQLTLNDDTEYSGGRLCFYTPSNGFEIPHRPAGTLTVHPPRVLHAVTRLFSGTRYSLFVLYEDDSLGDRNVVTVTLDDVQLMMYLI